VLVWLNLIYWYVCDGQVVRAKYKNMYPPRNANKTIKAKGTARHITA
jgi:hypothetical protein